MFLKALTLKGFKSFADATTLEFEPGLTVVVGPNGSGKSNVVDAIGWVLGAQAPSVLRSQRMDDVIFAGTSRRPALGRAEVTLTLDNSSGVLPIELSEVTVTRTLWRSGDSEYALNGVPCRLLDIQELLSDTGVGRQQHVIVGQGQIDGVLNARPEDRRMIIEEAAGILKHRKRKERSERRLLATEANLVRLRDLQREVRRQLKPLERQADAARRQGSLTDELRALQVYVAGRELSVLRRRLAEAGAARAEVIAEERLLRQRLTDVDVSIAASEAKLAAVGVDAREGFADPLAQLEGLREKARGLAAVLAERQRGIERERAALADATVTTSLEAEVARLEGELRDLDAALAEAEATQRDLADAWRAADEARTAAELHAAAADERHRTAEASRHALEARAQALESTARVLPTPHAADELEDVDAVLGTLLDVIAIDAGWEAAVQAACGEALDAVVVSSVPAARHAVEILAKGDVPGTVLALGATRSDAPRTPPIGDPVRAHVRGRREGVDDLLDVLLGAAVVVDGGLDASVDAAVQLARTHPHAVVVTPDGGRFAASGWRALAVARVEGAEAAAEDARIEAAPAAEAARTAGVERQDAADAHHVASESADVARRTLDEHQRTTAILADRQEVLRRRLEEGRGRLNRWAETRHGAEDRRQELERNGGVVKRLARLVDDRAKMIDTHVSDLAERRRRHSDEQRRVAAQLDDLRRQRHDAERKLEQLGERGRRAEVDEAEVRLRVEQATENCRVQLDVEPHVAVNAPAPDLPDGVPPAARVRQLEQELKLMGPVNPLALEEFDALQARSEFLQSQIDDVQSSRRELKKVIRSVEDEIVRVFSTAYADVSENLAVLFGTLFPGGQSQLRLTDPDDLLDCGVEIDARPSGKNVKKLSLLSGGERSLTALAFLFAVFRSRPSPFYVMDEVEAALDDVNLHRFLNLVAEFRREAQLVIVTHQKRTMEAAECLYGVTMQDGGTSKVVSENVAV